MEVMCFLKRTKVETNNSGFSSQVSWYEPAENTLTRQGWPTTTGQDIPLPPNSAPRNCEPREQRSQREDELGPKKGPKKNTNAEPWSDVSGRKSIKATQRN